MKKIFYAIALMLCIFTSTTATATVYVAVWPGDSSTQAEFSCDGSTPLPATLYGVCINTDDNSQIQIEARTVTESGYLFWVPTKASSNYEITIYVEQSNGGVEMASYAFETPAATPTAVTAISKESVRIARNGSQMVMQYAEGTFASGTLTNMLGATVATATITQSGAIIETGNLTKGMYILSMDGTSIITRRVMVQ